MISFSSLTCFLQIMIWLLFFTTDVYTILCLKTNCLLVFFVVQNNWLFHMVFVGINTKSYMMLICWTLLLPIDGIHGFSRSSHDKRKDYLSIQTFALVVASCTCSVSFLTIKKKCFWVFKFLYFIHSLKLSENMLWFYVSMGQQTMQLLAIYVIFICLQVV